jgi:hypothetical protein
MIVQTSPSIIESMAGLFAGRKKKPAAMIAAPVARKALTKPSPKDTAQTSFPVPVPTNDNTAMIIPKLTKAEAKREIQKILAQYGSIPSQAKLSLYWGRPKGTVSKWLKEWEASGLLIRTRVEKRKMIS